jgi:hypothetical protein
MESGARTVEEAKFGLTEGESDARLQRLEVPDGRRIQDIHHRAEVFQEQTL